MSFDSIYRHGLFYPLSNFFAFALMVVFTIIFDFDGNGDFLFLPASGFFPVIWGSIYFCIAVWIAYSFCPKAWNDPLVRLLGPVPAINLLFNASWIVAAHIRVIWLTMVLMVLIFTTLLIMQVRLGINYYDYGVNDLPPLPCDVDEEDDACIDENEKNFVQKCFPYFRYWSTYLWVSLYFGWISAALFANIWWTVSEYSSLTPASDIMVNLTIASIILCVFLAYCLLAVYKQVVAAAVIAYALLGIFVRQVQTLQSEAVRASAIVASTTLIACIGAIVALIIRHRIRIVKLMAVNG